MDAYSIRLTLRALRLSIKDFAEQVGVSSAMVSNRLKRDEVKGPLLMIFKALAVAVETDRAKARQLVHERGVEPLILMCVSRAIKREGPKRIAAVDVDGQLAESAHGGGWLDGWIADSVELRDALDEAIEHQTDRRQRSADDA